ncbi:MAG: tail protein X [Loktanella sp.]|nr:tail protein X [Loktanella sp.]
MAQLTETITVEGDGITVSLLIWRRFLVPMPGMVESVLALNPTLAGHGPYLPLGARVTIPIPTGGKPEPLDPISLW